MLYPRRPRACPHAGLRVRQVRLDFWVQLCVYVHFSATVQARLMILGQHLLLDETI